MDERRFAMDNCTNAPVDPAVPIELATASGAFAVFFMVAVVGLGGWLLYWRKDSRVSCTQPVFGATALLGALITLSATFFLDATTTASCNAQLWLYCAGFTTTERPCMTGGLLPALRCARSAVTLEECSKLTKA